MLDQKTARLIQEIPGYSEYEASLRKFLGTINSLNLNDGSDKLKNPDAKTPSYGTMDEVFHSTDGLGQDTMFHQLDLIKAIKTIGIINKTAAGETKVNYVLEDKSVPLAEFLKDAAEHKIFLDKDSFLQNLNEGDERIQTGRLKYTSLYFNLNEPKAIMDKNGLDTSFIDNFKQFAEKKGLEIEPTPVPLKNLILVTKIPSFQAACDYIDRRMERTIKEYVEHATILERSDDTSKSYALGSKLDGPFQELQIDFRSMKKCAETEAIYKKTLENGLFIRQDRAEYLIEYMKSIKDDLPKPFNSFVNRMSEVINRGRSIS